MKLFSDFFKSNRRLTVGLTSVAIIVLLTIVVAGIFGADDPEESASSRPVPAGAIMDATEGMEVAVVAGGCFWGVEAVFERLNGVLDAVSGYSGGSAEDAHYYVVGRGDTGHAEAVRIVYDPEEISFETLLEVFFTVAHDPTQLNYQGPDVGTEYRSVVFYANDEQKRITEEYIRQLDEMGTYKTPIVTEVTPLEAFYPAEEYHQDFLRLNPSHPYIVYWDMPKIFHLEEEYPDLVTDR